VKEDQLVEILKSEMVKAVKDDRAEALFASHIVTSALLSMKEVHEVEGVPVVDILAATLKMAEVLLDMKKAYGIGVCRKSSYRSPSPGRDMNLPVMYS